MKGKFLFSSNKLNIACDIYADKSSLILYWLLMKGKDLEYFSIREVARECRVCVGLVQRVFRMLTLKGYLQTKGMRTSKRFVFKKSKDLLKDWVENYSIIKKCKIWTYSCIYHNKERIIKALIEKKIEKKVIFALHSAAELCRFKNTNLHTTELYLCKSDFRREIEKKLLLEPREKGYEIILIEPYYKSILNRFSKSFKKNDIVCSSIILTYLDLYHFPLRGLEQAEYIARRSDILKKINKKGL